MAYFGILATDLKITLTQKNSEGGLTVFPISAENLAIFAAIAENMTYNAFKAKIDFIDELANKAFPKGTRHTFLIHMGENLTVHSNSTEGGITYKTIGDADGNYAHIIDHGTGLVGAVSVSLSTITEIIDEPRVEIVLEVYPVKPEDDPLVGLIWLDDIQEPNTSPFRGDCIVWSACQLQRPGIQSFIPIMNNTLRSFTFGMVAWGKDDSLQIVGQFLGPSQFMTPMGVSVGKVADIYPLLPARKLNQPDGMSDERFNLLGFLFKSGVCIFSEDAAKEIFSQHNFTAEEAAKLIGILHRMARKGWFSVHRFWDKNYFVPTPKLLVALR